jgi:hypothetical protein
VIDVVMVVVIGVEVGVFATEPQVLLLLPAPEPSRNSSKSVNGSACPGGTHCRSLNLAMALPVHSFKHGRCLNRWSEDPRKFDFLA